VLARDDARRLLDAIDVTTPARLRDRALIGLMVYSFARIGAALGMRVEDVFVQNRRLWVRLHVKGSKRHEMPCHHNREEYLAAYLDGCNLREDRKGPFPHSAQSCEGLSYQAIRVCHRPTPFKWYAVVLSRPVSRRQSASTRSG
jgi:site-specific recombinase XerC